MGGQRKALIVANDEYDNDALRRLKAPAADARALAHVLGDRDIGGFRVDVVLNEPAHSVEARIEDLFSDSQPDDLLLLHFSCHGLKSEAGELFFAARNTRPDRLGSTAIPADFIQRCMKSCRARSIVLFLDCCYGGAFGQGVAVRASGSANVLEAFPAGKLGGGRGRAVITASSSMEYAFEGNELADNHQQEPSVFTSALVEGLETGEADRDEDGLVSLNELYEFVFDKVREKNPNQTPSRDVEMQGELYVARSKRKRIRPLPIPAEVQTALQDPNMFTRLGAVSELRARLNSGDVAAALGAHEALQDLTHKDIKYVGDAAAEALSSVTLRIVETELRFGEFTVGESVAPLTLHLSGPPIARTCTLSTTDSWIRIDETEKGHLVSVDTSVRGAQRGSITVKGPTGEVTIPVTAEVVEGVVAQEIQEAPHLVQAPADIREKPAPTPEPMREVFLRETPRPTPTTTSTPRPTTTPTPAGDVARETPKRVEAEPEIAIQPEVVVEMPTPPTVVSPGDVPADPATPRPVVPTQPGTSQLQVSGWIAVVGGALMVLSVFLPFRWDTSYAEKVPDQFWLMILVGGLTLAGGIWMLPAPKRRPEAAGLMMSSAAVSAYVLTNLVSQPLSGDSDGHNSGFYLAIVAALMIIVAGFLARSGLARLGALRTRSLKGSDRLEWLIIAIGAAGALALLLQGLGAISYFGRFGYQTSLAGLLALGLPIAAVSLRTRRVGMSILVGWLVGAIALIVHLGMVLSENGDIPGINAFLLTLLALGVTTLFQGSREMDRA